MDNQYQETSQSNRILHKKRNSVADSYYSDRIQQVKSKVGFKNIFQPNNNLEDPELETLRKQQYVNGTLQKPKMKRIYKDIRSSRYKFISEQNKTRLIKQETPNETLYENLNRDQNTSHTHESFRPAPHPMKNNHSFTNIYNKSGSPSPKNKLINISKDEILYHNTNDRQQHRKVLSVDTKLPQMPDQNYYNSSNNSIQNSYRGKDNRKNQTTEEFYKTQAEELYQLRKKVYRDYQVDNSLEVLSPKSIQSKKNYRPLSNTQTNFRQKRLDAKNEQEQEISQLKKMNNISKHAQQITELENEEEDPNQSKDLIKKYEDLGFQCPKQKNILKTQESEAQDEQEKEENGDETQRDGIKEEDIAKLQREQYEHDELNHLFSILLKPEHREKFRDQLDVFIKDNPEFVFHLQKKCACFQCNCGQCKCKQAKNVISKPSYQMLKTLYRTTFNPSKIKQILQIHPNIYEQKSCSQERVGHSETTNRHYHNVKEGDMVDEQKSEKFKPVRATHKVNTDLQFNNLQSAYQHQFPKYPSYETFRVKRLDQASTIDKMPFVNKTTYNASFKNGAIHKPPKIFTKQNSLSNECSSMNRSNSTSQLRKLAPAKTTSQEFHKAPPVQTERPAQIRYRDNDPLPTGSPNYYGQYRTMAKKEFIDHQVKQPNLDDCPVFQINSQINSNSIRHSLNRSDMLNNSYYSNFSNSSVKSGIRLQFKPIAQN